MAGREPGMAGAPGKGRASRGAILCWSWQAVGAAVSACGH